MCSSSIDRSFNTVHCRSRSLLQTVTVQRCLFAAKFETMFDLVLWAAPTRRGVAAEGRCVEHTPILCTSPFAPIRFVSPLTMQCSSLCDCLIGSRTALRNKHACTHACTHLNAHSRFRVNRLFEKFLSALAYTASKTLDKTTLSQITIAQLMRKAATVRNTQVTLSGKTPTELAMGRTS